MSGKYALIIGNSEYTDPGLAQLTAPGKDAKDFAHILSDREICAFDEVNTALNEPSSSVIEIIDEFFDQKKPDDLLVLYFSGHGVRDEFGSLYLAFKNTIRSRLRSTAIKSDYIREVMDQSRSKRQVLILDCCNSGAFPQGVKAEVGGAMGMVSALQGFGRFVLTASDATQFAWEGNTIIGETENSLFTHFLVNGLKGEADTDGDGKITVDELYDYAYDQISRVTPKQTPTKSSSKQEGEIVLRQITRVEDIKLISLPAPLMDSIDNPIAEIRLGAVQHLTKLLNGKNLGMARSAKAALERIAQEDDSQRVKLAARQALDAPTSANSQTNQTTKDAIASDIKRPIEHETNKETDQERLAQIRSEAIQAAREREQNARRLQLQQKPLTTATPHLEKDVREQKPKKPLTFKTLFTLGGVGATFICCIIGLIYLRPIFLPSFSGLDTPTDLTTTNTPLLFTNTPLLLTKETDTPTLTPIPSATYTPIIPPTISPTFTLTATPTQQCDLAQFIRDVSIPDGTQFAPSTSFTKTWQLKNVGACTWSGYTLIFVSGDAMGGGTSPQTIGTTPSGENVDISVSLKAPSSAGLYRGYWQIHNTAGLTVPIVGGTQGTFYVSIKVVATTSTSLDLYSRAVGATWISGAGILTFGGPDTDINGFAMYKNSQRLEDGSTLEKVLETYPQGVNNGVISGRYPAYSVVAGEHFSARIGFLATSDGTCGTGNAKFQLNYKESGVVKALGEWTETCDGVLKSIDIDLSALAGKTVEFVLAVLANGVSNTRLGSVG